MNLIFKFKKIFNLFYVSSIIIFIKNGLIYFYSSIIMFFIIKIVNNLHKKYHNILQKLVKMETKVMDIRILADLVILFF